MGCGVFDVTCHVGQLGQDVFSQLVQSAADGAAYMLRNSLGWWTHTGTIDVQSDAVRRVQELTLPVTAIVLTASVVWQGIRMIVSRRGEPGLAVVEGLVRYVFWSTAGLALLAGGLRAGDALAQWWLDTSTLNLGDQLAGMIQTQGVAPLFDVLLLSIVMFIVSLVQWLIGFFRMAAVLVLAGLIPLAASGGLTESTKPWLRKVLTWTASLAAYKPLAALIYSIGFTLLGDSKDFTTLMVGVTVLVLSVLALPVMMKFFSWGVAGTGGGGGMLAAAGATGAAVSTYAMTRSSPAVSHAALMDRSGPGSSNSADPAGADTDLGWGLFTFPGVRPGSGGGGPASASGGQAGSHAGGEAGAGTEGAVAAGGAAAGGVGMAAGAAAAAVDKAGEHMTAGSEGTGGAGSE